MDGGPQEHLLHLQGAKVPHLRASSHISNDIRASLEPFSSTIYSETWVNWRSKHDPLASLLARSSSGAPVESV